MKGEIRLRRGVDHVLGQVKDILDDVDDERLEEALSALEHAQRVFLYGAGRSGLVARAFAIRLMHLGYQTFVIGETITAPVAKGDVVLLISGSGETYPVVMTAEIAKNIGATVVSITHNQKTGIAALSDIVLALPAKRPGPEQEQLAPLGTLFESATWILLDGFVADLMVRTGQTEVAMRKRHATLE
ncbi:MAG: 6-phospho-3-hexuloisomerase [Euryarchaeota archaeon]|nr:6-phospho-3-hexuloisomerase [Euryarchaeota archaeon]